MQTTIEPETGFINSLSRDDVTLIDKQTYRKEIREHLPEEALKPSKEHMLAYFIGMSIMVIGYNLISSGLPFLLKLPISIIMGVSITTLTFFLHDLMHGSIIQSPFFTRLLGMSVGAINLFSPSFWKRVHNFHHARTGALDDPDRAFISSETPESFIEKFMYKTRLSNEKYNMLFSYLILATGFFWYFLGNISSGIFACNEKNLEPKYREVRKLFNAKQRAIVITELLIILVFQIFLYISVCQGNLINFILASVIPVGVAHMIAMLYIHTNHFLSPLTGEVDDPLINSLSLENTKFVDSIFLNFSHHVEHHLFPAMNSKHYPKVREVLKKLYPERFQLIPMKTAISMLASTPRIYDDYTNLVDLQGRKTACLLPKP